MLLALALSLAADAACRCSAPVPQIIEEVVGVVTVGGGRGSKSSSSWLRAAAALAITTAFVVVSLLPVPELAPKAEAVRQGPVLLALAGSLAPVLLLLLVLFRGDAGSAVASDVFPLFLFLFAVVVVTRRRARSSCSSSSRSEQLGGSDAVGELDVHVEGSGEASCGLALLSLFFFSFSRGGSSGGCSGGRGSSGGSVSTPPSSSSLPSKSHGRRRPELHRRGGRRCVVPRRSPAQRRRPKARKDVLGVGGLALPPPHVAALALLRELASKGARGVSPPGGSSSPSSSSAAAAAAAVAVVDAGEHVLPPRLGGDAPRGGTSNVEEAAPGGAAAPSSSSLGSAAAAVAPSRRRVPRRGGVERVPRCLQPGPQRASPEILPHLQVREGPGGGRRGRGEAHPVVERRGVARALEHLELDRGREGREGLRVNRAVRWDEDIEPVVGIRRV